MKIFGKVLFLLILITSQINAVSRATGEFLDFGTRRFVANISRRPLLVVRNQSNSVFQKVNLLQHQNSFFDPIVHLSYAKQHRFYSTSQSSPLDEKNKLLEELKLTSKGPEYADPTTDTGFKQLLSPSIEGNKEIIKSFLNTFVPEFYHDPVREVTEAPFAIPTLPQEEVTQTFMDMHVVSKSGYRYVIEMQAQRHINFDERALYYAASTYSRQLLEKDFQDYMWYRKLKPVIAIQVLGYDSNKARGIKNEGVTDNLVERVKNNPLPKDKFMKHFVLTDKNSSQEITHLQMIQIELPRVKQNLFPPQKDFILSDWWLSIFKFAPYYTQEKIDDLQRKGINMPEVIKNALERLYYPKWNPKLLREYKTDTADKEKFYFHYAVERAEGKAEGKAEINLENAQKMLEAGIQKNVIKRITGIDLHD